MLDALTPVFTWWLIIFIFGLAGWPLAFSLLRHLPDRGFALARPVGLLLTGYILWLGGTFHLLQNNAGGILVALVIVLATGLLWQRQQARAGTGSLLGWLRQEWRYALAVELLFNLAFFGWTIFKAYNPNIETAGGEKWMEIAFINGVLRSDSFPPQDPWLSGFAISYYYFGYVLMAMITRLAGLVSTVAYNLYIPTLFALTLTGALGIVANLVGLYRAWSAPAGERTAGPKLTFAPLATGLLGALFVAILSNLEGLLEVLHRGNLLPISFWTWLDIRDLTLPPVGPTGVWLPDRFMWWWRGSRVLTDYSLGGQPQEVIDEFPFFSFLLGDVHPHVLALPFVLLVVALALNLLANRLVAGSRRPALASRHSPAAPGQVVNIVSHLPAGQVKIAVDRLFDSLQSCWHELLAATGGRLAFSLYTVCLGGLSFLNTWDFPIYLSVVGLSLIVWLAGRRSDWRQALWPGLAGTAMLGLGGVLLYLPFYLTFQSQARGLLPNLWNPSRLPQFLVFFGPFLVAVVVLLLVLSTQAGGWRKHLGWAWQLTVLGPVLLMLLVLAGLLLNPAGRDYVQGLLNNPEVQQVIGADAIGALVETSLIRRILNPWTFLLVGSLLGWALALFVRFNETGSGPAGVADRSIEKFVLILLLVGLALPLAVEFVYLRDNFGIRMNTIFKFYFQAWVLLALVSAFSMYYVSQKLQGLPLLAWQAGLALLVAAGLVYPVLATPDKAGNFQGQPTLNGIAWIAEQYPGDYAAIQWLRANAPPGAVILEAPGVGNYAAYNYTGRISAMTGLPTLLGWGNHESQWRGNYDEPGRREPDIEQLYNSSDIQKAQMLLDKYNITYVYVGPLERERYSPQGLNKFERFMAVVFRQDDVTIYRRK